MTHSNIILTGFMGTGKTAVGREVAERLGRPFVDLDVRIVERAGKSIPAIFAEDGEPAFRALEATLCQKLRQPAGLVIATGGGAVLDPANREALAAGGVLICLDADPDTILARLAGAEDRPLLADPDRRARIATLLAQRAEAYAAIPHHLDTTHLSITAAAERVLGMAAGLPEEGHRLIVDFGFRISDSPHGDSQSTMPEPAGHAIRNPQSAIRSYDVLIADGLLAQAGQRLIAAGLTPGRCAVVTNPTVRQHHGATLIAALAAAGFEPLVFEAPDGEAYKTLVTVAGLYGQFADARLARNEPVIALGGGVIGDMAGFVAATWLRGVPLVQIPTSLLAMVDASVGGKVAVDLPAGKNLVGAFKQPELVLIDPEVLATLPAAEFRSGLAEVLKAGVIGDKALFERLAEDGGRRTKDERRRTGDMVGVVADAVRVKARIVERDPFEMGDRAWLNLGHTFGHALELLSGYTLRHGEAVALGTIAAAEMSASLGYCAADLPPRIRAAVERLGLPTSHAFDPSAALAAMGADKKRRGRSLRFVLPRRIGQVEVVEGAPEATVLTALERIHEA
ncbi:MAG: 3-dehydroquinate synthase [Chloroflexi bacterium]|nr:3-dehydroquinate synthase [Chloroflexota bacterium]